MTSTAWALPISRERVDEFRELLAELNTDLSGLAERARAIGYHQERMWLQPEDDGGAQLVVALEFDDGLDISTFSSLLLA